MHYKTGTKANFNMEQNQNGVGCQYGDDYDGFNKTQGGVPMLPKHVVYRYGDIPNSSSCLYPALSYQIMVLGVVINIFC